MSFGGSLLGSAAGIIIAQLLSQGFTKLEESVDKQGNTVITGLDPNGKIQSVRIKNNAMISPQYDLVRITTNETTRPDNNPQYTLKNDSGVIKRIFSLSVIPDGVMQTKGLIQLNLNGVRFYPITSSVQGTLTDTNVFTVPIPDTYGMKILPKDKLEVFIWNPTGETVSATVAVFIGELP